MPASLLILTFHTIDDQQSRISFPPGVFRRAMAKLHNSGYRTMNLLRAMEYLLQGVQFPRRALAITFDDGYQTVYEEAFPVLQYYGMSATVFLTVGKKKFSHGSGRLPSFGGRSMLSWQEIKEMHRRGITFGAHTLTHPDLTRLPLNQVKEEIVDSKTIIEDTLSTWVSSFAYPYGRYDDRSREIVQQHFACGCSDELGLTSAGSDRYALERVDACYFRRDRLFDIVLTRIFPWYVSARNIPLRVRRIFAIP